MALDTEANVSVGTSATALYSATSTGARVTIYVNSGAGTVYVGDSGVTTTTGLPVAAGEFFPIDLNAGEVLYGIVASSTSTVRVMSQEA